MIAMLTPPESSVKKKIRRSFFSFLLTFAHTFSPVFLLTLPCPNFILLPLKRKILEVRSRLGHEIPQGHLGGKAAVNKSNL